MDEKVIENSYMRRIHLISLAVVFWQFLASAQLTVAVSQPKVTGSKAVVKLEMKNAFEEPVQSARATVFLVNGQNKVIGQSAKWVIGGTPKLSSLAAGGTNAFFFVFRSGEPFTTTNLTAKVTFGRVLLKSGKVVDVKQKVELQK